MAKGKHKKPAKSSDPLEENFKKVEKSEEIEDGFTLGEDYWNRVADDVASGYKNKADKDRILNEDQLADDHERADKEAEEGQ